MRLVAIALIAGCSSMPDVNGNPLGESGHASLAIAPGQASVSGVATDLDVTNTGDGASGDLGARLVDGDAERFVLERSTCSVLQPGGHCTISVRFAPPAGVDKGSTTLELDEDGQARQTADLDGKITPAIRWVETSAALTGEPCSVSDQVTRTVHLMYSDIAIGGVMIAPLDTQHWTTGTNTCIGATGTDGTCAVDIQTTRGTSPLTTMLEAKISDQDALLPVSYQLGACDLAIEPDPVVLTPANPVAIAQVENDGPIARTIQSSQLTGASTLVVENDCPAGTVLAPHASCSVKLQYMPSAMAENDAALYDFVVTTHDAGADDLRVHDEVQVDLVDTAIHFDQPVYDWGSAASAGGKTITVLAGAGGAGGAVGPLTIAIANKNEWTDNNNVGSCSVPFTMACAFQVSFLGDPTQHGPVESLMVASDGNGARAYAILKANAP